MQVAPIEILENITPENFQNNFFKPGIPVVIKGLSRSWPAIHKWNWDYCKEMVGEHRVGNYNNIKSDAYTPVNMADDYTTFVEYIDRIRNGPAAWRIFLFNIFNHAPQLTNDFTWPDHMMRGFVKRFPMLFVGGAGSITHMHFDIDLSHILHTQFLGRKRVLLFPFGEQHKLYRKPFEVLSMVDFSHYYDPTSSKVDEQSFPALKNAKGMEALLEHGDTLFMPSGYWHHMEYLESGFAMSLRALPSSLSGKLKGIWNIMGMRTIDTFFKKTAPEWWYLQKNKKPLKPAQKHDSLYNVKERPARPG